MKPLTKKDEMMMLAILRLEDNASLLSLRDLLHEQTGKTWSIGNVFVSLEKLEKLRYITSAMAPPSGKQGGKSVKYYQITHAGMAALKASYESSIQLWDGLTDLVLKS